MRVPGYARLHDLRRESALFRLDQGKAYRGASCPTPLDRFPSWDCCVSWKQGKSAPRRELGSACWRQVGQVHQDSHCLGVIAFTFAQQLVEVAPILLGHEAQGALVI